MSVFVILSSNGFPPAKGGGNKTCVLKYLPGDVTVEQIQKLLLNPDEKPHVAL